MKLADDRGAEFKRLLSGKQKIDALFDSGYAEVLNTDGFAVTLRSIFNVHGHVV